jgi:DNA-directed RNA polymerase specialized sigma24 family protein
MLPNGSITLLLHRLRAGDEAALSALHARCWPELVQLARTRLRGAALKVADEDDVAQEALWGFWRTFESGRVTKLDRRHDFFALLTHITACKVAGLLQREFGTDRRGGGHVLGEGDLDNGNGGTSGWAGVAGPDLPPDERAALHDAYAFFMGALEAAQRGIAELHLAGLTNQEVARQLGCSERTIERKLSLIRDRWQEVARPLMVATDPD